MSVIAQFDFREQLARHLPKSDYLWSRQNVVSTTVEACLAAQRTAPEGSCAIEENVVRLRLSRRAGKSQMAVLLEAKKRPGVAVAPQRSDSSTPYLKMTTSKEYHLRSLAQHYGVLLDA